MDGFNMGKAALPSGLNSIGMLQSLANPDIPVDKGDIVGLIGGALVGWLVAKKWPNMVVKYVGMIVGAELGILAARMIKK